MLGVLTEAERRCMRESGQFLCNYLHSLAQLGHSERLAVLMDRVTFTPFDDLRSLDADNLGDLAHGLHYCATAMGVRLPTVYRRLLRVCEVLGGFRQPPLRPFRPDPIDLSLFYRKRNPVWTNAAHDFNNHIVNFRHFPIIFPELVGQMVGVTGQLYHLSTLRPEQVAALPRCPACTMPHPASIYGSPTQCGCGGLL